MPDGDKVHEGLEWKFQKVYKQVCEGHSSLAEIAKEAAQAVQKDVESGGDVILHMVQTAAAQFDDILNRKWAEAINWRQEIARLDALERSTYAHSRLKRLAYNACREILESLRHGIHPPNCYITLLSAYQDHVYEANFEERVPLKRNHYNGVSQEFVGEQLEQMRPLVQSNLLPYAESIYRNGTVKLPRKPSGPRGSKEAKPHYDIDTDIPVIR